MCRIHTETIFCGCGHSSWTQTSFEACECKNVMFKMEASMEEGQKCQNCSEETLSCWPKEKSVSNDSIRRYLAFRNAQLIHFTAFQTEHLSEEATEAIADLRKVLVTLAKPSEPGGVHQAAVKNFAAANYSGIEKSTWAHLKDHFIPLDFHANEHLIDRSHFISPDVTIVPPGTMADNCDRCGFCWGSFSTTDLEESCSGEGARRLPCGHIFGSQCLRTLFQTWKRPLIACPHCRAEYRSIQARRYSEESCIQTSIMAFEDNNGLLRKLIAKALFPWFVAVMLTMDTAPKLNIDSGDHQKEASHWLRAWMILIVFSSDPFILILGWLQSLGRDAELLLVKMGFNFVLKIGSIKLGIILTMLIIAMANWLAQIL